MVDGYTERRTDSILTAVAFADGVFFVVLAFEIELEVIDDGTGQFGQTIFFNQG
jgi:hypothetical protein